MKIDSLEIEETVATSMESLQQYIEEPLISNMLSKMNSELDKSLTYHCYSHTLDVMKQALALAEMDDLTEHERLLLMIAAAFHDAGFLLQRPKNEPIGAEMAREAMLASKEFSVEEQEMVWQMIMDTQLNAEGPAQTARTHLSPWLLDADLANLGRDDFWHQTTLLSEEMQIPIEEMLPFTHTLMARHGWLSPAGQVLFSEKKQQNLDFLMTKMVQ